MPIFIVRYSEIGLKGPRKRSEMERRLVKNITAALSDPPDMRIWRERGRIFLEVPDTLKQAVSGALGTVFGIKSFSECTVASFDTAADLVNVARDHFATFTKSSIFAVRATRTGHHDFTSIDIERRLGEALLPGSLGVDLENPDFTARLDIREKKAYLYDSIFKGAGGFPLGTQGKMVSLVSGGIDSPVAAWMMMKRGCIQDIVFCSLAPPIDTFEFLNSIQPLVNRWSHGADITIHIFNGSPLIEAMAHDHGFIHPNVGFKKFLYELAGIVNTRIGGCGIVTGESVGQVSSQTAENLSALSMSVRIPIYRPLIGFDKEEIIDLSRHIGTFPETSLGEFCSIFSENPSISIKPADLEQDEVPENLMHEIIQSEITVRKADFANFLESIRKSLSHNDPSIDGALIVDLRSEQKYRSWHPEGSIHVPLVEVTSLPDKYGKNKTYLFYCSKGLMSAYAASRLKSMGINTMYTDEAKLKKMISENKRQ
ncbi:MAG: tRNA sulfurtransferase [Thermoplasmata archaeon]